MKNISRRGFLAGVAAGPISRAQGPAKVFIVPNFHPASCGWLTNFSKERVYCANSYFDHLDRVRDDPNYAFALSEVNNLIAMMNFHPERTAELKRRIKEGRVELVNAFFLESTVNLSGGEALVRLGVEGLRWQERVFGVRPRFAWTIDVCGTHAQMAQIASGLGLEAMVYTRKNPTGSTLHWAESPDGTRVLAISPGPYGELRPLMAAKGPLTEKEMEELDRVLEQKRKATPTGAPVLVLAGNGDYALAPARAENPSAFLKEWSAARPGVEIRFATPGQYLNAIKPEQLDLPVMRGGTAYDFDSFWIQNPRVKEWYRRSEHSLAVAEAAATYASLQEKYRYPVDPLYQAWVQMFLNMDRNTLWGAAGGMVFEHERSWDASDRFRWVERAAADVTAAAAKAVLGSGEAVGVINPVTWERKDPFWIDAGNAVPEGAMAQADGGRVLCRMNLQAGGIIGVKRQVAPPAIARPVSLPDPIVTSLYTVRIDPGTGALTSLKLRPSNREMLGGPANVIVAERPKEQRGDPGDHMVPRPRRNRLGTSGDERVEVIVNQGVSTVVEVRGTLLGKPCVRRMWFHDNCPRIDCETELNDVPDKTVVVAEFPLAASVIEMRRGIPYGFAQGVAAGIAPAVRWSHYQMSPEGGFAILDRGVTGRELNERTPLLYLLNASEKYYGYPNAWLSGAGRHVLRYALAAHNGPWEKAGIPQLAWEFNAPPVVVEGCGVRFHRSWVETSENVIVESLRRDGGDVELRLAECLGVEGGAEVTLRVPHESVAVTDLTGGRRRPLAGSAPYRFPIRAQQIVTLRFRCSKLAEPKPVMDWEALVPEAKRAALREYSNEKGHPPRGN